MKKTILYGIVIVLLTSSMRLNAQWARTYGGIHNDYGYSIQQTTDGGYIIAGLTESFGAGGDDVWILKLTSMGAIEWKHTYGGSNMDCDYPIQETSEGGYIVAGETHSFGAGENDFWILKLDSAGAIEWQGAYGGVGEEYTYTIEQTSDGGYIVAGNTESFGAGNDDFWILKLTSAGEISWQRTYGGYNKDCPYSIQQTGDGGYIIAGETYSFGAGESDFWILKLASAGKVEWQRACGGINTERAYYIQQTKDGNYIVAGCTESFGAGGDDIWILKLTSHGSIVWQRTYGGNNNERAHFIQQTNDGGYIVTGFTFSFGIEEANIWVLKLNSNGDIQWQQTYGLGSWNDPNSIRQTSDGGYIIGGLTYSFGAGEWDLLVLKLDSNGNIDPSCGFIESSDALVSDTHISPLTTSVEPVNTNITAQKTNISPQDTAVNSLLVCSGKKKGRKRR